MESRISILVRQLTSKFKITDGSSYMKNIFTNLKDIRERTCLLLFGEVYVKAILQYHGGIIFGKAVNKPQLLATTILNFMIVTLFGGPKFFSKMLPVRELEKFIFEQTNLIFNAMKNVSENNVGSICHGNWVNQEFFQLFDKMEPWPTSGNMLLLSDFFWLVNAMYFI